MLKSKIKMKYSYGAYNKYNEKEQWIRITEGCPNNCPYCYEPQKIKIFGIPEIVRNNVKIMDMNLLCKPDCIGILQKLGEQRVDGNAVYYELVCGIDYRFLTSKIADELKSTRIRKIRMAWDWYFKDQYKIKKAVDTLKQAKYKGNDIMVFMICNWKISFESNMKKLELLKVWNCQVSDCWYDNQLPPNVLPTYWTKSEIKEFRKRCRKHNQLVTFGIDPENKCEEKQIKINLLK